MDAKTLKILFIIFIIMLGIVFLPSIVSKLGVSKIPTDISFSGFTKDQISEIKLQQGMSSFSLTKQGNQWNVASYSASLDKVNGLFQAFKDSSIGPVVSRNGALQTEYGFASDAAMLLTLQGNSGTSQTLAIGKAGPSPSSFYAKKVTSSSVYLVQGGLLDVLSSNISDWRDRAVLSVPAEKIQKIEVTGIHAFTLEKSSDTSWTITSDTGKKALATTTVQPLITRLSAITASDFYAEAEVKDKQLQPSSTITVYEATLKKIATLTVIPDNAYYLVLVSGKSDPYKVAGYNLDDFLALPQK